MGRRTTPADRQLIQDLYTSGLTIPQVAAKSGFSEGTVSNVARAAGILGAGRTTGIRTSPELEAQIIALYERGIPWAEIMRQTGRTEHTVSAVIKRNGGKLGRKPVHLAEGLREQIPLLYQQGLDAPEIGRQLSCHPSSVYNVLKELGIDRRQRIPCGNPGYFDRIDTPDKAYWLGFIGADGCVTGFTSGNPRLAIKLARKDRSHLVLLHKALGANRPIRDHDEMSLGKFRPCSTLTVYSPPLAEALVGHGITPRKSATLQPWEGPSHLMPHYWRGLVDGDGSITVNDAGVYVSLVGSQAVARAFLAWARTACGSNSTARQGKPGSSYWVVQVGGTRLVLRLLAALYDDAPTALARKKTLADLAVHGKPLAATLF
jgi:hypothetical protein